MNIRGGKWYNWSGGVSCRPKAILSPKNEVDLAAAVRGAEGPVRVPGSGHSFTPVCASGGTLIDLSAFRGLKSVDTAASVSTFAAATRLWAVGPALYQHGLGLKNMGDIDRQ